MSEEQFMQPIPVDQLAKREDIRVHTIRGKEQVKVKFENITVRPGFNEREDFGDIEGLALAILNEGLLFPIWVDMLSNGTCLLVDGERRFKAIQWLRSQGHLFDYIEAVIAPKNWTEIDRLFFMAQANNGGKLMDDMELGRVFIRLVNQGVSQAEISRRMGNMSEMVVGNRIVAAKLTDREKTSVTAGEISLTAAVLFAKKEANPAVRQAHIKEAANEGKKLQVKDVLKAVQAQPLPDNCLPPKEFNRLIAGIDRDDKPDDREFLSSEPRYMQNMSLIEVKIGECLAIIKTLNSFIEPGNIGGEYTLKLENKLRELKGLLS
jgi:ParB-like chromosome segregation protein Spo0J